MACTFHSRKLHLCSQSAHLNPDPPGRASVIQLLLQLLLLQLWLHLLLLQLLLPLLSLWLWITRLDRSLRPEVGIGRSGTVGRAPNVMRMGIGCSACQQRWASPRRRSSCCLGLCCSNGLFTFRE